MAEETASARPFVRDSVTSSTLLHAHLSAKSCMCGLGKTGLNVSRTVAWLKRGVFNCVSRVSCHSCELMADTQDSCEVFQRERDFNDY